MSTNIKLLQKSILEVTEYFDEFCKRHDVTYYLMGGSALGALRHKGFIPWDDDLDVFMTYENYQKFIQCAKTNLDTEHFYLEEEGTKTWPMFFTKLKMNNTTFIEENTKDSNMHQGVYIDVMCLNNVSSNNIYRFLQYCAALMLTAQTIGERGYSTNKSLKKKIAMFFTQIIVRGTVKQKLLKFVRSLNSKETDLVGHFFGKAPYKKTCFPKSWLGMQRYVPFENIMLPIPQSAEEYLTLRFGDYMKMPNEKTLKEYPVHAYFVDLKHDYKQYKGKTLEEMAILKEQLDKEV